VFGDSSHKKRVEVEDTLDEILKCFYPYYSQGKSFTNMNSVISSSKVKINIMPKFLPFGKNDATSVKIGVKDNSVVKVEMWRTENFIFIHHKDKLVMCEQIDSDSGEMVAKFKLNKSFSHPIIVQLKGKLVGKYPSTAGQYQITDELYHDMPVYQHLTTNMKMWARKWSSGHKDWFVSNKVGDTSSDCITSNRISAGTLHYCPAAACVTRWREFGSYDYTSDIEVTCSVHK